MWVPTGVSERTSGKARVQTNGVGSTVSQASVHTRL